MCNYVLYNFHLHQVQLISQSDISNVPLGSVSAWLEQQCLLQGTTLKGRLDAFKKLMKVRKFIPAVISASPVNVYFPSDAISDPDTMWICYQSIGRIDYHRTSCRITFLDGQRLDLDHPRRVRRLMDSIFMYLRLMEASYSGALSA